MQTYQVHQEIGRHLVLLSKRSGLNLFCFFFFLRYLVVVGGKQQRPGGVACHINPSCSRSHPSIPSLLPADPAYPLSLECSWSWSQSQVQAQTTSWSGSRTSAILHLISEILKVDLSDTDEKCLKQYLDIVIPLCATQRRRWAG